MTAEEVKEQLRGRHPAIVRMGYRRMPGPWTVTEEMFGVDFMAWAAWARPKGGGAPSAVRHPRIGYEVKVSRSDMRTELLRPHKRARAVALCHRFYFAVPAGLLKPDELQYEEPAILRKPEGFARTPCPEAERPYRYGQSNQPGPCEGGERSVWIADGGKGFGWTISKASCVPCRGRGYLERSPAERIAPTLWVPADVGLVAVDGQGCMVIREAPINHEPEAIREEMLAYMLRWVSVRPDPRHADLGNTDERVASA